jgi:transposase
MPRERLSMRKIKEVLRLRFEHGLSHRAIAHSCGIGVTTAREYLMRAKTAGLCWPLPEETDEARLEALLFPPPPRLSSAERGCPDWLAVHVELRRKGVTLQLLWQEYREVYPNGYGYSRYCELYRAWAKTLDVTMRFEHKAGETLYVDYAGQTMDVVNPQTGEAMPVQIFVAAQGASNYTFAEATWSQNLYDWIGSHVRALEFFGGVNAVVVPDNTKVAVTSPHRYEPDLNKTYLDWAQHYGCAVIPTRSVKPRDKAKVEAAVLGVERWVMAPLRNRTFFSIGELNRALAEQLEAYNTRSFQKLRGSRRSLFEELDRPALRSLPSTRYQLAVWKEAKVNIDYHIEADKHRYSVPYQLVHKKVDVRSTQTTLEIFFKGKRVATHKHSSHKGGFTTLKEHMPKAHQAYAEWTSERLVRWACKMGGHTEELITQILAGRPHPQQGFRSCLGILRLGKQYGNERLEAACKRALALKTLNYKSIESILKNGLDKRPLPEPQSQRPVPEHANVRGPDYYSISN